MNTRTPPKFRLRRLWALMRKEAIQIITDPSSILIAFILPVILLFIFGFAVSLDTTRLRIGVVLEERTRNRRTCCIRCGTRVTLMSR